MGLFKRMKKWTGATRSAFVPASLVPVLVGTAVAWWSSGTFIWERLVLCMAGVVLLHLGANLVNDYFDWRSGADDPLRPPTPFSGGSRYLQRGELTGRAVLVAAGICLAGGLSAGIYLDWVTSGHVVLWLTLAGAAGGFFYTAGPLRFSYHSLGEPVVALCFGLLPVWGACYVQVEKTDPAIWVPGLTVSVLIALLLFVNEIPDHAGDAAAGKRTWVVLMGPERALLLIVPVMVVPYVVLVAGLLTRSTPWGTMLTLAAVPLVAVEWKLTRSTNRDSRWMEHVCAGTVRYHLATGLLLVAGYVLSAFRM